MYIITKMTN